MAADQYGLTIDPDGDFTSTSDYLSTDPATYPYLSATDPNYVACMDSSVQDSADRTVHTTVQLKYGIRLRWKRLRIKVTHPQDWIDLHNQYITQPEQQAIAAMQAYWLANMLMGVPE